MCIRTPESLREYLPSMSLLRPGHRHGITLAAMLALTAVSTPAVGQTFRFANEPFIRAASTQWVQVKHRPTDYGRPERLWVSQDVSRVATGIGIRVRGDDVEDLYVQSAVVGDVYRLSGHRWSVNAGGSTLHSPPQWVGEPDRAELSLSFPPSQNIVLTGVELREQNGNVVGLAIIGRKLLANGSLSSNEYRLARGSFGAGPEIVARVPAGQAVNAIGLRVHDGAFRQAWLGAATLRKDVRVTPTISDPSTARAVEDEHEALLQRFAPTFVGCNASDVPPVVCVLDFVKNSNIFKPKQVSFATVPEPVRSPSGDMTWSTEEVVSLARRQLNTGSNETGNLKLRPRKVRWSRVEHMIAMSNGKGVYGIVHPGADGRTYSIKYFMFSEWNETAYAGGFGNHSGDWMCIDLQVTAPRSGNTGRLLLDQSEVVYAIYHNHGRQLRVPRDQIRFTSGTSPLVYLEEGTNETWPNPGGRGFAGWPTNVATNKDWGGGTGLESEHKVVRNHFGQGVRYFTRGKVLNLNSSRPEAVLIRGFAGKWGTKAVSAPFGLHDATTPNGPRFNSKMWSRAFTTSRANPWRDLRIWYDPRP